MGDRRRIWAGCSSGCRSAIRTASSDPSGAPLAALQGPVHFRLASAVYVLRARPLERILGFPVVPAPDSPKCSIRPLGRSSTSRSTGDHAAHAVHHSTGHLAAPCPERSMWALTIGPTACRLVDPARSPECRSRESAASDSSIRWAMALATGFATGWPAPATAAEAVIPTMRAGAEESTPTVRAVAVESTPGGLAAAVAQATRQMGLLPSPGSSGRSCDVRTISSCSSCRREGCPTAAWSRLTAVVPVSGCLSPEVLPPEMDRPHYSPAIHA